MKDIKKGDTTWEADQIDDFIQHAKKHLVEHTLPELCERDAAELEARLDAKLPQDLRAALALADVQPEDRLKSNRRSYLDKLLRAESGAISHAARDQASQAVKPSEVSLLLALFALKIDCEAVNPSAVKAEEPACDLPGGASNKVAPHSAPPPSETSTWREPLDVILTTDPVGARPAFPCPRAPRHDAFEPLACSEAPRGTPPPPPPPPSSMA